MNEISECQYVDYILYTSVQNLSKAIFPIVIYLTFSKRNTTVHNVGTMHPHNENWLFYCNDYKVAIIIEWFIYVYDIFLLWCGWN